MQEAKIKQNQQQSEIEEVVENEECFELHVDEEGGKSASQNNNEENDQIFTIDQESIINKSIGDGGNIRVTVTKSNTLPLEDDKTQSNQVKIETPLMSEKRKGLELMLLNSQD